MKLLNKRLFSLVLVGLVLASMMTIVVPVQALSATLHVGVGYPYADIQDAIDAATGGDTILVHPGTYGPIIVDRQLTIKGINAFIEGSNLINGWNAGVFVNTAGVILCGFTIQTTSQQYVISIWVDSDNAHIMDNKVYATSTQAFIAYGIFVTGDRAYISNNEVHTDCYIGIYVDGKNARIMGNKVHAEGDYSTGIWVHSIGGYIACNKINCKSGIFVKGDQVSIQRNTINAEAMGIWLYNSSQSRVETNTITGLTDTNYWELDHAYGIYIQGDVTISKNNLLCDNTVTGSDVANSVGIGLNSLTSGNRLVLSAIRDVWTKIVDDGTGNMLLANWL